MLIQKRNAMNLLTIILILRCQLHRFIVNRHVLHMTGLGYATR